VIAAVLLAWTAMAACSRRETPAAPLVQPVAAVPSGPVDGGRLVRRLDSDISTLNPILSTSRYDRFVANYLFTPLLYLDRELRPIEGLASSWEVEQDGLLYRFKLNEKATFSDGTPVRAADVVFTLRKIVDPQAEAVQIAPGFEQLDLARTRAVDEHTVEVGFRKALAAQLIRFNDVLVLPEHVYAKEDFRKGFLDRAVGSGPYRLRSREIGRDVVLERRADFWGTPPHIQTVVFKVIEDNNTAWAALQRGDVDESFVLSDTWLRARNDAALQRKLDFQRFYTLNYNFIAWNTRDGILSDRRVRRALASAIPLESVVQDLYQGTARAMSGPFTPDQFAYNPNVPVIRHDPDESRRLLLEAGWRDENGDGVRERQGKRLRIELTVMAGSATTAQFAQMVQAEAKNVGIDLQIVTLDSAAAIQRILAGNFQAAYMGWDLDPDPDPYAILHSSQFPPRGQNFVFYSDPEADRLMTEARQELDRARRKELYWRLHEILARDQPYTWTIQGSSKWAINRRVQGVGVSAGYGLFLWYPGELGWWLEPAGAASSRNR
jgi:peptide/nickel transport system substrate-binding protein